jgi:hypothetical protein
MYSKSYCCLNVTRCGWQRELWTDTKEPVMRLFVTSSLVVLTNFHKLFSICWRTKVSTFLKTWNTSLTVPHYFTSGVLCVPVRETANATVLLRLSRQVHWPILLRVLWDGYGQCIHRH